MNPKRSVATADQSVRLFPNQDAPLRAYSRSTFLLLATLFAILCMVAAPNLAHAQDAAKNNSAKEASTKTEADKKATAAEAGKKLRLQVRRLVRQLDDRVLANREEAEAKLIQLGDPMLELLPKPEDASSEEVKHRITRIRQQILLARSKNFVKASTITLQGKGMLFTDVLAAFEEQTGNQFQDNSGVVNDESNPKVDVDFQDTPFWKALDQVLDQVGLKTYHFSQNQSLVLQRADEGARPRSESAHYLGAFRIEPIRVFAQRDLRQESGHRFVLSLEVAWEPRLRPIALKLPLADLKAEDEQGNPIKPANPESVLPIPLHSVASAVEVEIPLEPPLRKVTKIARIQGTIQALVPGAIEPFEFTNLEKARQKKIRKGAVTVVLQEVRGNNDLWDVRILLQFDETLGALASHRGWFYLNDRKMINSKNQRVEELAEELASQTESEIGLVYAYEMEGGPQGHTFIYETPTSFLELPLKFELKDIRLP